MKYHPYNPNNRFHHYKIGERVKVHPSDYKNKNAWHFDDGSGYPSLGNRIWVDAKVIGYINLCPVAETADGMKVLGISSRFKTAYNNNIRPFWYVSKYDAKAAKDPRSNLHQGA